MSKKMLKRSLAKGKLLQICAIVEKSIDEDINTAEVLDEKTRTEMFDEQSCYALRTNLLNESANEYADTFPYKVSGELPSDKGIRHEIDVAPGTKYCIKRQWRRQKKKSV
ncbi:reverse transcriptase [Plasmopara halstedii]|uniref:Reverse transcriptase n=1 Tax=Plasmopara halstedii TaxID=4781 RepID=A0A0P1AF32_PLAHL|nr:reverse transcriptase [Plasmopara halstedii]CEG39012.1 reverse transcriptase [Plasmopara halstedii]|eukprot:XP_024575381.1 reverse transcriptase [Plasmopara halstedii]